MNQFYKIFTFLLFILSIYSSTVCNIPPYIVQAAQNYAQYLQLPYSVICDNSRLNISDSFVIIYNDSIDYKKLSADVSYFIVTKALLFTCKENVFHTHLKIGGISKAIEYFVHNNYKNVLIFYDDEDNSEVREGINKFTYYGAKIDLLENIYNESKINETLNSYDSYENVIIINLFSDPRNLTRLLAYYQKYKSIYPVYFVSYYVDESYIVVDPEMVKDTHLLAGFLHHYDSEEMKEFIQRIHLDQIDYFDDLLFQVIIVLEFLKYIPALYPKDNQYLIRRQLFDKSINIAGQRIYFSPCNTFVRNIYLGDIDGNGNMTNVVEFQTNVPNYHALITLRESCPYIEEQNVITFGFLSSFEEILHWSFLEGISTAVDEINRNESTFKSHILLRLPPKIDADIDTTFSYLKQFNPVLLFYFIDNDNTADIIRLINKDPDSPLIFTYGFFTGRICNPKFFYLEVSQEVRFKYMQYQSISESVFIISSNSDYGSEMGKMIWNNIYVEYTSIKQFYCETNYFDMENMFLMMKDYIKETTILYIIIDSCEFQNLILHFLKNYSWDNKVNFFNLNYECDGTNDNWKNYYLAEPFISVSNKTTIYKVNHLLIPNDGVSAILYSGYYGVFLYYKALITTGISDLSTLLPVITKTKVKNDNGNELFFSNDHYLSSCLQYGKTIGTNGFELIDESPFSYISHAFYPILNLNNIIQVCDWNNNKNHLYTSISNNFPILIIDTDYYLADFTQAIINNIAITKTADSLVFSVYYYPMHTTADYFVSTIKYFYSNKYIKCVVLNEEYDPKDIDIYDLPFIVISTHDDSLCDDRIFNFGFSRNEIIRTFIDNSYEDQISNFIYITKIPSGEVDSTSEYYKYLISSLYVVEINYTSIYYTEIDRIKDIVLNTNKPTYMFIGLSVEEDFLLTKYLVEDIRYDSRLITIIHSNNLYIYYLEHLNLKNNLFPIYKIQLQQTDLMSFLESFVKTVSIDFYTLYITLFYLLNIASDTYYKYSTEFMKQLSKASYKVFEFTVQSSIANHQLNVPISYAIVVTNDYIIYGDYATEYITNTYTLLNYNSIITNDQLEKCDIDSGLKLINVTVVYYGVIRNSNDLSHDFLNRMKIVINIYIDSIQTKIKNIFLKLKVEEVDDNTDPESVLKKFRDAKITNIFGFYYYHLLEKYLPYLKKYNIIAWYASGIPTPDFCNDHVISFYVPISLVSLIQKESNNAILIYSDRIYFNKYVNDIVNSLNDYKIVELFSYKPKKTDDNYVSDLIDTIILELMKNENEIYLYLRDDDFEELIPKMINTFKTTKSLTKWSIISLVDFPVLRKEYEEFNGIKFITNVDFSNQTDVKKEIDNIYKAYSLTNRNPSNLEQYMYIALSGFVTLVQKTDYNNDTVVQNALLNNILYNDKSIFQYSFIESSLVKRINFMEYDTLFYFHSLPNLREHSGLMNHYNCYVDGNTEKELHSNYAIAVIYDRKLKSEYFIIYLAYMFESIVGSYINGRFISIMEISYDENDENELYLSEIESQIDQIDLIICATNGIVRDKIDKNILRVYQKVMYYLYDDKGNQCSPYIIYYGMSTQGKIKSEINYISENCESVAMIYDNSEYSDEEIQSFKEELSYFNIHFESVYKVLNEKSDFSSFLRKITYSLDKKGCVLNFLEDSTTLKILSIFNNYTFLISDIKLISLSLKFNTYKFSSSNINHIIINYFNPINPLPIYNNIMKLLYNSSGISVQLHQSLYNAVNAVSIWKLVMMKTKSRFSSSKDFLLAHTNVVFNNGKYNLKLQDNHHISHSRIVIYQEYLTVKPKVVYESKDIYQTYVYSNQDSKLCFELNGEFYENYIPKEKVLIGFIIPINSDSLKNIYPNFVTGIVTWKIIKEKIYSELGRENIIFNDIKLRINDEDENECIKVIKYCIKVNVKYVITPVIASCIRTMSNYINDSSLIIFATDDLMGNDCNSKFVYTSKVPNQIINPTIGFFTPFVSSTLYFHIIYDNKKATKKSLEEIISYSISSRGCDYSLYKFSKVSTEVYSVALNIFKHPGVIMTFLDATNLKDLLAEISHYNLDKNKWIIVSFLVSHESLIYNIPSKYLDNIYISSLITDEVKSKPILDYSFLTDHQPIYSGSTEIALEYIYDMIVENKSLKGLYGKVFHSELVGDFQLDESNSLRYPFILTYYNNGIRQVVFPSSYLFKPNPLLFTLRNEQCDFSISDDITPVVIRRVQLGLVYQKQSDLVISSVIAQILNYMAFNIEQGVQYFAGIEYLTTDDDVRKFIQDYIDDDSLNPCILLTHPQFTTEILDLIESTDKMFYITNFRNEYCLKNLITTEAHTMFSLGKVVHLMSYILYELNFYLFYDAKLTDLYEQITALLIENGYEPIYSVAIEDYDEEVFINNIEVRDCNVIMFCDTNDEMCEIIKNIMEDMIGEGSVFYIQWFYESPQFVNSFFHFVYGSSYPDDTQFKKYNTLKYYIDKNNETALFDHYSLNKIYDLLKVIYMWMEIEKLENPNDFNSLYSKEIETEVGPIKLNPNNRISSHMILYLHYYELLFELPISNFVELTQFDKNYAKKDTALQCNWRNGNGLKEKKKLIIGIISEKLIFNSRSAILVTMLRALKDSQYYEEGLLEKYSIETSIKYYDDELNTSVKKNLIDLFEIDSLVAVFDFTANSLSDYVDIIGSKDVLYFDIGYAINSYCSDRIFDIGLSVISLVRYTLLDCIETIKIAIIVHGNDDYGEAFIEIFKAQTEGLSIEVVAMGTSSANIIRKYIPRCLEVPKQCVILLATYLELSEILLGQLVVSNISLETDMLFYYYLYFDPLYKDQIRILKGAKFVSSFLPTVSYYDTKGSDPMIYDFGDYIVEAFSNAVDPIPILESVVVGYEVLKKLLLSMEEVNFNVLLTKIHNLYFDSPAGPIYFGNSSYLMIDIFFSKVTTKGLKLEDSRKAVNPLYWNNTCSSLVKPIIVGLVFDFSNTSYYSSQIYSNLLKEMIVNQNRIGGINDRQIEPILYSLYNNDNDIETIESLMNNSDISIILGCVTHYCNNRIIPYLSHSEKLLFSNQNFPTSYCQPNVITIGFIIQKRLKATKAYLETTTFERYVLIYYVSERDSDDISYFTKNGIKFEKVFPITTENCTEEINEALNFLENITQIQAIALFNLLSEIELLQFEEEYIQRSIKTSNFIQVIFNLDEYILGFDLLSKLSGSIVVSAFTENSNSHLATLFEETVHTRFGNIRITQGMALYDVSIKLLTTTYKQAEKLAYEDGIIDSKSNKDYILPFEYLRRAAQMSSFESSCGTVGVTVSNEVVYTYEIGFISPNGNIISVKTDVREAASTNEYNKNCYFGPKITIYKLPNNVVIPTLFICVLNMVITSVVFGVIIKYRKRLKACSPFFVCFFIVSADISIVLEIVYNDTRESKKGCETVVALLFMSIINCVSVIVFKTWRIHSIYNNIGIKKSRITDMKVLSKIGYILIPDAVICLIFGLCNSLGSIQSNRSIEMSTSIEYVNFQKCQMNLYFTSCQVVIFLLLASLGLYYSWGTRKTSKEYNDSQAMAISLGLLTFLITVTIILETSLDFELDIKYIFEIIGSSVVLLVVLMVLVAPKFYLIVVKKKTLTNSTEESVKQSKFVNADILPKLINEAFAVDYSKLTHNNNNNNRTTFNKTRLYPQKTAMNTRLGAMIPGAYARKQALEMVRCFGNEIMDDGSDGSDSDE